MKPIAPGTVIFDRHRGYGVLTSVNLLTGWVAARFGADGGHGGLATTQSNRYTITSFVQRDGEKERSFVRTGAIHHLRSRLQVESWSGVLIDRRSGQLRRPRMSFAAIKVLRVGRKRCKSNEKQKTFH